MKGPGFTVPVQGPFRLAAVAVSHGWFQTEPFRWDGEGELLHRVEDLGDGTVALVIGVNDGGVRCATSRALSASERALARTRVRRMLQLDVDLDGFEEAVEAVDPELARDLAAYGGGRVLAGSSLFEDVVKGICGTNTTWRQAVASINRVAGLSAGEGFPSPADLLRAGEERLRGVARVGYRAPSLIAAARAAIDGTLADIEADSAAGDEERVYASLLTLTGVGPATAGFILLLMGHFARPSIDSATIRVATEQWFGGTRPTPRQLARRIAPAGEFAGLVVAWATLRAWQRTSGLVDG